MKKVHLACEIDGVGYGSSHDWMQVALFCDKLPAKRPFRRHSVWECQKCYMKFRHFYRDQPDIFKAIEEYGLPDKCYY